MSHRNAWPACLLAEFDTADALRSVLDRLRQAGYRTLETYTPLNAPRATDAVARQRSWLPLVVLLAGIVAAIVASTVRWYAGARSAPVNGGGRSVHVVPAFLPATFGGTVLLAALAAVVGFILRAKLPALWPPLLELDGIERSTIDRFWVEVRELQTGFDLANAEQLLTQSGALRVVPRREGA